MVIKKRRGHSLRRLHKGVCKSMSRLSATGAAILVLLFASISFAQKQNDDKTIKDGSTVSLEYTLSDEKGKVIESNKGGQPLIYTQGKRQIIPGLEKSLAGMKVNDQKKVRVKPEEGYGPVDPKKVQEVPKEKLPPEALKPGTMLVARGPEGQQLPVRVSEVKDKTVVLDLNHPLAGKTLTFDVKVLAIKPAEAKAK